MTTIRPCGRSRVTAYHTAFEVDCRHFKSNVRTHSAKHLHVCPRRLDVRGLSHAPDAPHTEATPEAAARVGKGSAVVIGAGVSGLTAALALARAGMTVKVCDCK